MIVQVSYSDTSGGASRASHRLFLAMRKAGSNVTMCVADKGSDHPNIVAPTGNIVRARIHIRRKVEATILRAMKPSDHSYRTIALASIGMGKLINKLNPELVNLHWINDGALSIGEIAHISCPIVWTLHDAWAFCGAEHYMPQDSRRYIEGYRAENRNPSDRGSDIDRWTWQRKKNAWLRPLTIISPSAWLAECARKSALMRDWDIRTVPNPLDVETYRPLDSTSAKRVYGIPVDRPVIAFGAFGATSDRRKGFHLLTEALEELARALPEEKRPVCVVFGLDAPENPPDVGLRLIWLGILRDDVSLVRAYSCADVVVVPSLQENLPQTATEAQACGVPVVGFDACGMPDAVEKNVSGLLAKPYDTSDLARCILALLGNPELRKTYSREARERAVRLWSYQKVTRQYRSVFDDVGLRATNTQTWKTT